MCFSSAKPSEAGVPGRWPAQCCWWPAQCSTQGLSLPQVRAMPWEPWLGRASERDARAAQGAEHSTLLPEAAPGRLHPNPRNPARSAGTRRCLPRPPQVLLVEHYPAELGKARALPGSQLPDPYGSHLPRAWRRKRASRTPPPFRSAPQAALSREEPSARSVLNKDQAASPLRARARRKAVSRGARSSRASCAYRISPRTSRPCLSCSPPSRLSGTRVWGWGRRCPPLRGAGASAAGGSGGSAARGCSPGQAALRWGAGFFVGCRVTGSH